MTSYQNYKNLCVSIKKSLKRVQPPRLLGAGQTKRWRLDSRARVRNPQEKRREAHQEGRGSGPRSPRALCPGRQSPPPPGAPGAFPSLAREKSSRPQESILGALPAVGPGR